MRYHVPPRLPAATLAEIEKLALTAYRLLGCRDFARLDFRLDAAGRPHFLECNALPGLNAEYGDIVLLSRGRVPYAQVVQGIFRDAAARWGSRSDEHIDPLFTASRTSRRRPRRGRV